MKISAVTIYKLEATDKELDTGTNYLNKWRSTSGPYYRINGRWYATYGIMDSSDTRLLSMYKEQLELLDDSSAKCLETNFQDMMPFKGQLELF